jgi:hypothetical protein
MRHTKDRALDPDVACFSSLNERMSKLTLKGRFLCFCYTSGDVGIFSIDIGVIVCCLVLIWASNMTRQLGILDP